MGSTDKTSQKEEKKSVEFSDLSLQQAIPKIIHESLQEVREDIHDIKESSRDLHLMVRGIHAELSEMKSLAQSIGRSIERFIDGREVKTASGFDVGEIATGLDLITKIPQHLRRTFQVVLQLDRATARSVARRTGKSRPLESDYLNQLSERGFLEKKHEGRKAFFYYKHAKEEEDEEEEEENDYMVKKQMIVNNANHANRSHGKKNAHHY
ncbi:MAG: hypothetical protein ACFFBQ_05300 [Promethearchaeota archaeon]